MSKAAQLAARYPEGSPQVTLWFADRSFEILTLADGVGGGTFKSLTELIEELDLSAEDQRRFLERVAKDMLVHHADPHKRTVGYQAWVGAIEAGRRFKFDPELRRSICLKGMPVVASNIVDPWALSQIITGRLEGFQAALKALSEIGFSENEVADLWDGLIRERIMAGMDLRAVSPLWRGLPGLDRTVRGLWAGSTEIVRYMNRRIQGQVMRTFHDIGSGRQQDIFRKLDNLSSLLADVDASWRIDHFLPIALSKLADLMARGFLGTAMVLITAIHRHLGLPSFSPLSTPTKFIRNRGIAAIEVAEGECLYGIAAELARYFGDPAEAARLRELAADAGEADTRLTLTLNT